MNATITKIVAILAGIAIAVLVTAKIVGARAEHNLFVAHGQITAAKVEAAQSKKEKEQAQKAAQDRAQEGQEWHQAADKAVARAGQLEGRLKAAEAKLDEMGPAKPVTDPTTLPSDTTGLVAAFTVEGFRPTLGAPPAALAFTPAQGQPMLGLIKDGREYPKALERTAAFKEEVGALQEQKGALAEAVGAKAKEADANRAAYETEKSATEAATRESAAKDAIIAATNQEVEAKDALYKAEKPKKWIWGGAGVALAILVAIL